MAMKKANAKGARKPASPDRVEFYVSDQDHEKGAKSQKAYLTSLADRVEAGEPLTGEMDRQFASKAIRAFAESIPLKPKRKQGPPPKFCHGSEALVYASYRVKGMAHGEALAAISDRVGASETAVAKAINKYRKGAFAMFDIPDPGNK